ncbi:MAG: DUF2163 domain-containing protein [Pseudomonadota bacterium]
MIELPQSLKNHLAGSTTTICYVWILERSDGLRLGFTDHDREIEIEGVVCAPTSGFTAGAIESSLGLSGDTNQVDGALSADAISEADIVAGLYDGARVFQYLVNWQDVSSFGLLRRYHIGEITQEDGAFRVEMRSFSAQLDQTQGRHYLRNCDAMLGDGRCGINLNQSKYHVTGSVITNESLTSQTIPFVTLEEYSNGWFAGGKLYWLSGALSGKNFEIADMKKPVESEYSVITLVQPLPHIALEGDVFELSAGCDKSFQTCKAKFNNSLNFRGFPHMPSNDSALTYADDEMQFNGDPLVP